MRSELMNTIEIRDLKEIFHLVIEKIEREFDDKIILNRDYYWSIDETEKYNPYEEPQCMSLGQISFDVENLKRLKNKSEVLLSTDFILIAELLKAIRMECKGKF